MFGTLVKTELLVIADETYRAQYFELRTVSGHSRFSLDILLGPSDRVILDDDSLINLEARAARLVPATIDSRRLARATAA